MLGIHYEPLAGNASLASIDSLPGGDSFGLFITPNDSTNTAEWAYSIPMSTPRRSRVDRGVDYVIENYETLLRRLAE